MSQTRDRREVVRNVCWLALWAYVGLRLDGGPLGLAFGLLIWLAGFFVFYGARALFRAGRPE